MKITKTLAAIAACLYLSMSMAFGQAVVYRASNYGSWSSQVYSGNASTGASSIVANPVTVFTSAGLQFIPFQLSEVITIDFGLSTAETISVTPSNCFIASLTCTLSGTFAFKHTAGAGIISGTYGLQDAIVQALLSPSGGTVFIDSTWQGPAGSALITAAVGTTAVVIQDNRSGTPRFYQWGGSSYIQLGAAGSILSYNAFGDSISYGQGPSNIRNGWVYKLADNLNIPSNNTSLIDTGTIGNTANDATASIYATVIPTTSSQLETFMIGTNETIQWGANANQQANFQLIDMADDAWMMIPASAKKVAQNASVTYTGSWVNDAFYTGIDKSTSTNGATATVSVTGTVIYLGYTMVNANAGTFAVTIDGVGKGTFTNTGVAGASLTTLNGISYGPALARFAGLSNSAHTVVVTMNSGSGTVYFDWVAGLSGAAQTTWPIGLFNGTPGQNPSEGVSVAYSNLIQTNVATLSGDGLRAYFLNTQSTMTAPADFNDQYHPNDSGTIKLVTANLTALNSALGTSLVNVSLLRLPLYNNSPTSQANLGTGLYALNSITTGSQNVAFGYQSGQLISTGNQNAAFGGTSLIKCVSCTRNTALGFDALNASTGNNNTGVGAFAAQAVTSGANETALGYQALFTDLTGTADTAIGGGALLNATGANNTALGQNASTTQTSGSGMTCVGSASCVTPLTATNSGAWGYQADVADTLTNAYQIGVGQVKNSNSVQFGSGPIFLDAALYSAAGTPLPTCAVGYKGAQAVVSDATTPTYMGAYTSGGAITATVICSYNGTTYSWLTH